MHSAHRIVVSTPLHELWNEDGSVDAVRVRDIGTEDIRELLRRGPLRFVVAEGGLPLHWVPEEDCFHFWKSSVQSHLPMTGTQVHLDDFSDGFCYFASEWSSTIGAPIIVLETVH